MKIYLTIILLITSSYSFSQTIKELLTYSDFLYQNGRYAEAIPLYERVLFFTDKEKQVTYINEKLGDCYKYLGDNDNAQNNYSLAIKSSTNDSIKNELRFKRISNFIRDDELKLAQIELWEVNSYSKQVQDRVSLYQFSIHYFDEKYEESYLSISNIPNIDTVSIKKRIRRANRKYPRANLAMYMSYVIPGSGQLYSGNIKEFSNSLLLTGSLSTLFVITAIQYSYLDAMLSVWPWYQRYFVGGARNAYNIAAEKREHKVLKNYNQILNLLDYK